MTDETPPFGIDPNDERSAVLPRSPTRRRLLALLAASPIAASAVEPALSFIAKQPHDPVPRLFAQFEAILAAHERALARVDRLEVELVARLGYPRVRLPTSPGQPPLYAADASTIDRHLRPGAQARRLRQRLRRRQRMWAAAADACGPTEARRHEATVARAVRAVGAVLMEQPAMSLAGVRLKLVVLLALHAPGGAGDADEPWHGLHALLADLAGQLAEHEQG